ncbi:molybdate ABC transporter substrate-binding protein [Benzoatithermus flavus]|uniref:Molybdate ABC transporter substrate-binding protein n=1 Tax=Benzoatithermus flavus TaxID=3108223 RepID=A0ABU8XW16_9PROT
MDRRLSRRRLAFATAAVAFLSAFPLYAGEPPLVAAAADLQPALEAIAAAFTAETGETVRLVFGSSGNFARQIRQGAPFALFLSADEQYVLELARDGLARDEGALYAVGRIALLVPAGSPLQPDGTLADLRAALADGRLKRLAIANPEHAPYGRRAEEALRHAGLWEAVRNRLVYGENVAQAAQFASTGAAQAGIVAYSLALSPKLTPGTAHALIPADWHQPLNQRMALLKSAGPVAERFYDFLRAPAARAIFRRSGFVLPDEQA